MLCVGACKAFSVTTAINNGWNKLGTEFHDSSNTAAGVDVGSMSVSAFWKEHTGSESNPTVSHSASPSCSGFLIYVFQKGGGETWDTPVFVGGGDSDATSSAFSVTCNADPGVAAGDAVVFWSAWGSDGVTPMSVHCTCSQTGITFTRTEDPATDPETTTGGDMGMCCSRATVTGTSSAAPVISGTQAANLVGSAGFVRLRVSAAAGTYPGYDGGGWFFREQEWMRDPRIPRLGNIVDLAPIRERIDRERLIAA